MFLTKTQLRKLKKHRSSHSKRMFSGIPPLGVEQTETNRLSRHLNEFLKNNKISVSLAYARCFRLFSKLKCMDDAAAYLSDASTGHVRLESFGIDDASTLEHCVGNQQQQKQKQDNIKMFSENNVTEVARGIQILIARKQTESMTSLEVDKNVIEHNYAILQDPVEVKDEISNLNILHNPMFVANLYSAG